MKYNLGNKIFAFFVFFTAIGIVVTINSSATFAAKSNKSGSQNGLISNVVVTSTPAPVTPTPTTPPIPADTTPTPTLTPLPSPTTTIIPTPNTTILPTPTTTVLPTPTVTVTPGITVNPTITPVVGGTVPTGYESHPNLTTPHPNQTIVVTDVPLTPSDKPVFTSYDQLSTLPIQLPLANINQHNNLFEYPFSGPDKVISQNLFIASGISGVFGLMLTNFELLRKKIFIAR